MEGWHHRVDGHEFEQAPQAGDGQRNLASCSPQGPKESDMTERLNCRIDWSDLLAVQGTFKSLLQHHSSKASILRCSAFFMFQLSHPYMATGKT